MTTAPAPPPIVVVDAYRNDLDLQIRYLEGGVLHAASGRWPEADAVMETESGARASLLPLVVTEQSDRLPSVRESGTPVQVLQPDIWQEVRTELFSSLVPDTPRTGLVVSFDSDDYFVYPDAAGEFRVTLLRYRPPDYRLGHVVRYTEYIDIGLGFLKKNLAGRGISGAEFVVSTGAWGNYALPFIYADLNAQRVALLQNIPRGQSPYSHSPFIQIGQTAVHLVKSHTWDLIVRPATSIHRLVFLAKDTAVGVVRPDWVGNLAGQPVRPLSTGPGMDLEAFEAELAQLTGRDASRGTLSFLIDGEAFFSRLVEAMLAAVESIHLRIYIFDNDDYALEIADLLRDRSAAGIDVKVLLDGLGTGWAAWENPDSMPPDYRPPPSVKAYLKSGSATRVRMVPNTFLTGDHVKTIVIDRRSAFVGGMNIGREYRYDWHDMMFEVRGPVVDELRKDFNRAWAHAGWFGDLGYLFQRALWTTSRAEDLGYPVRVLYTKAARSEIFLAQLEAIRRAQRYVYIENAYFTDDTLLYELVRARQRGVDVRVIIPMETDRGLITRDNALAANIMLEFGIRVFVYPGMSHLKAAIYDGWICLGSANFDNLSLRVNKEINLATSEPAAARALLEQVFEPDFAKSAELTEPFPERFSDYLLEIIGDLIY